MPSYKNGNYYCYIDPIDGTKVRYTQDDYMEAAFPESLDIKITNKCCIGYTKDENNNLKGAGCPFCHENSGPNGLHGDILNPKFLDTLHPYTELAIGGGDPLEHPDLEAFLVKCKAKNIYCNITVHANTYVNQFDIIKRLSNEGLIHGIGVSVYSIDPYLMCLLKELPNVVCHIIAGIVEEDLLLDLSGHDLKILILGYKVFRRGENCYKLFGNTINRRIEILKNLLPKMRDENWFNTISFDNLALKQLEVDKIMSIEEWNSFYMGSDGTHTGYINLVDKYFAVSSTKTTHWPLMDTIEEMFQVMKANKDCE